MKGAGSSAIVLALVVGGGLAIGALTAPGEWYAELNKPTFTPPGWVFGPAWLMIHVCIAVAGWLVWRRDRGGWAMKLWSLQLALNFLWSPTFFAAHWIELALALIVALLATIFGFIAASWRTQRHAALLFAPYAAWVAFATALNAQIVALN